MRYRVGFAVPEVEDVPPSREGHHSEPVRATWIVGLGQWRTLLYLHIDQEVIYDIPPDKAYRIHIYPRSGRVCRGKRDRSHNRPRRATFLCLLTGRPVCTHE